jgi:hypothetical protein
MSTHVEHRAIARPPQLSLFSRFTTWLGAGFKTWRAQQIERANIEALAALGPDLLNDVGVTIHKAGKPPKSIAICNPHLIAMDSLSISKPTERGEF